MPAISPPLEVNISSPDEDAEVGFNRSVSFTGSAIGGTSPYTYQWYSDVDGLLGTGPSISAVLSGSQRENQIMSHIITLRATDNDGIVGTRGIPVTVMPQNTADIRSLPVDASVWLFDSIVTADFTDALTGDFFYVEADDRSFGIRVDKDDHGLGSGKRANITGSIKVNQDKERYVEADMAVQNNTGTVDPVQMNNRTLGGGSSGAQDGTWSWKWISESGETPEHLLLRDEGLNNIGLLVKTTGKFTYVDSHTFKMNDGSGEDVTCLVETSKPTDPGWKNVLVQGISSCKLVEGKPQRLIRVETWDDVTPL